MDLGYMQGALGSLDPARPVSARLGAAAAGLEEAMAKALKAKLVHKPTENTMRIQ